MSEPIEQWGTHPPGEPEKITWWPTKEDALMIADKRLHCVTSSARTSQTEDHRPPRTVTITQTARGVQVHNDFKSEEVSDLIVHFSLGLKAFALSVEEQTEIPAKRVFAAVIAMATDENSTWLHRTDHIED